MMQLLQTMMEHREVERAERQANIAALQQIAQNNQGHGNHDHPGSKLKNFQNTNPPMFNKTEEPLDADDWLQTMENNLEVAGVEAAEKVLFATHYLSGPAEPGGQFLTLSRYAPDETDTNEKRKERFLNGLHDEMQTVLVNIPFADLEALVDSTIQMEGKLHQANENRKRRMMNHNGPHHTQKYRNNSSGGFTPRHNKPPSQNYRTNHTNNNGGPPKPGGNNNNSHHNNNNPNSHSNNGNNNTNTGPRTGSNAISSPKGQVNCYECGVVGHYSNECPKKLAKIAANTAHLIRLQHKVWGFHLYKEGQGEGAGHPKSTSWPHPLGRRPNPSLSPNPSRLLLHRNSRIRLGEALPEFSTTTATTPSCAGIPRRIYYFRCPGTGRRTSSSSTPNV
ncbi:hypothetical protein QYE76_054579 [Lolium multiflorum]|uniref:CCHC-type domain-containing protein n=1 Tax=Lolium multiflorum TaxID=4521 RepID=A0AAD8SZC6_LOLMU|nr:hypothetical protein QYE76_054579 [Lolium multiflorum]